MPNKKKSIALKLRNYFFTGVIENVMHPSNIKIFQKILNYKSALLKTGIFSAIVACWGVILFGTFLTFK